MGTASLDRTMTAVKIWIDIDNTPHVPFFVPVIRELERRGHNVVLTARDAFQVCELADQKGLRYKKVGIHHGKHLVLKVAGTLSRSASLAPFCLKVRPHLAISHGSRAQIIVCNILRIPTIAMADYEHTKTLPFAKPRWLLVPDCVPINGFPPMRTRKYRGIKEDVYAPDFKPDRTLLDELGLDSRGLIVAVRPPATEAHYHNPEANILLDAFMNRICKTPDARAVLLPRNRRQESQLRDRYPDWFADRKTIVPTRALDGLNLLWHSDLVVSGGGTMNREAAALGVPVYSIFRGPTGAVDSRLEREGRLTMIRTVEEVHEKIALAHRAHHDNFDNHPRPALSDIVKLIEEIIVAERISKSR